MVSPPKDADAASIARRTWVAAAVCVVALAAIGAFLWMRRPQLEPIEVSQQTTYIITPTRADGWVDYREAVDWMRRASLDAGGANAALPLLKTLGTDVLPIGVDRGALLVRLGVTDAGGAAPALKPLAAFDGAASPAGPEPPPAALDWLRARCPADAQKPPSLARILAWLAQSDGALKELRTAAKAASLYVPVPRDAGAAGDFDRVNPIRVAQAADALGCRAAAKLMRGDAAASWDDTEALWRLGQLLARAATAGEYAVAASFWKTAMTATVDLAASPVTTPEQLSAIQAGLGAKLGFAPATETWMFQRLAALDANGTPNVPPRPGARGGGPLARIGTTARLTAINQDFDAVDVALQTPDPKQRIARVEQAAPPAAAPGGGVARSMLAVEIDAISRHRLASLAVTLARRARDGGKLPASLAELQGAPKDPGSGGPFSYIVQGTGFRLYGVGGDGNDDRGDPTRDVVAEAHDPPRIPPP